MKIVKILIVLNSLFLLKDGLCQYSQITGYVTNGKTNLPFARVRIKATQIFTMTDYYGKYILKNISIQDTVIVTAWAEGHYNGEIHAVVGDTGITILLHQLPTTDNPNYEWISPDYDSSKDLNCGNCHTEVLMNQWQNNAHGQSAINPFFHAMYYGTDMDGNPNIGVGYKKDFENTQGNCATCHIPGAAANNPWGVDPKTVTGASQNGVFCDFCHKIFKVRPSSGQGTTGVLSIELLRPFENEQMFFGPFDDIHKPDAYLPLIRKSEFCAPCHTGKFWDIPAYNCFNEWKDSPYPSMGIECQTCHMFPDTVTTHFAKIEKGGLQRNPLTIPSHFQPGSREPKILANSVTMNIVAEQLNDTIKVMVTIYNDKTGHHVPTGRPSRNMILLVTATKTTGDTLDFIEGDKIPSWGGKGKSSNGNYAGYPGKGFAKILQDFVGNSPSPSWRPSRILSDNRIAAFDTDTSYYFFKAPSPNQKITINATLIYRRFFKEWMKEKKFNIPDIMMENETIDLLMTSIDDNQKQQRLLEHSWLSQNYPNPFNVSTTITFRVAEPGNVRLSIYDVKGRMIKTLINKNYKPGVHHVELNMSEVSTGIYFYEIYIGQYFNRKKMIYIK